MAGHPCSTACSPCFLRLFQLILAGGTLLAALLLAAATIALIRHRRA
jgi:hypothetical protein